MLVSVIITTRNEEKNIERCMKSIEAQFYPLEEIEIIVVDNNSVDKTKDIACKYTDKVYDFGPERSAQRNYGVGKSEGKYILYLDADMNLSEKVIEECVWECEQKGYIALYIPEKIIGKGFWIKVRNFERSFYNATCIDAVRFIRRDKLLGIGGFDENLTGPEDWDLDQRIGKIGKVSIIKAPIYHNEQGFNFRKYTAKKTYYSANFDKYIKKWGKRNSKVKKQLGLWYRFFGVFFERGKWLKLLKHPLLAAGMYFLRIRVGLAYVLHIMFSKFNLRWN